MIDLFTAENVLVKLLFEKLKLPFIGEAIKRE